jgi:hypothetical protein
LPVILANTRLFRVSGARRQEELGFVFVGVPASAGRHRPRPKLEILVPVARRNWDSFSLEYGLQPAGTAPSRIFNPKIET